MNDNDTRNLRARMMAEQAVARMNGKLRRRIDDDACEGLVEAIIKTGEPDKFLFRPEPFRSVPPRWSLSGLIARAVYATQQRRKRGNEQADAREALSSTHYKVQRSGAVGLIITLLIALLVGITDAGKPLELGLLMARDAVRRTAASGDIVVIAKDDRSAKLFGGMPWKRRYDAQLVDRLREMGAKLIVFNQIMADPSNPIDDGMLAAAFDRAGGNVWLSAQPAENSSFAKWDAVLPTPLFREKTRQAHFYVWHGMFNHIEYVSGSRMINKNLYPSQASVLSGVTNKSDLTIPDFSIDYDTIPTVLAFDILRNSISNSSVTGKTVIISDVSEFTAKPIFVLGQGRSSPVYSMVIAAETLKAGVARRLGYIFPLLVCAIIGIACILNDNRKNRAVILIGGTATLLLLMFIGDRLRLHVDMIPALFALMIMGIRESTRSTVITAMTTNELTGLPNLSHLRFVKGYQDCIVVAIKIERYRQFIGQRPRDEQKILLRAIVARINVIAPDCLIHQGEGGLFVFLVPSDSRIDVDPMPGQLHALFTQEFLGFHGFQRIGISVGVNDDLDCTFDARRAVAIDRAEFSEFVTLQAVQ